MTLARTLALSTSRRWSGLLSCRCRDAITSARSAAISAREAAAKIGESDLPVIDYSAFEPPYLKHRGPPIYKRLNVQFRGYDYIVIDSLVRAFLQQCRSLELDIGKRWSTPAKSARVALYHLGSMVTAADFNLNVYDRTVQLSSVSTLQLPILLNVVTTSLPAGVRIRVKSDEPADEAERFVPDYELIELQKQLEEHDTKHAEL